MQPKNADDHQEQWNELVRALSGSFKEDNPHSNEIIVKFTRWNTGQDDDEIGIYSDQIDNCYDEEQGCRWEVMLNKDGTWRIS